jgi:hypothetical protein
VRRVMLLFAVATLAVSSVFLLRGRSLGRGVAWRQQVSPGRLSESHAFLENDCAACHSAVTGVERSKCVACHASSVDVIGRQPSAFHASIRSCRGCHVEHQGTDTRPTRMDHAALARIGMRELGAARPGSEPRLMRDSLVAWLRRHDASADVSDAHPAITRAEMTLECASCHSNKDPHVKLFGRRCADCHGTTEWTIAAFIHPSPRSTVCAQCHQAPPSHSMMHFEMVDKPIVARGTAGANGCCADVQVNQCYRCHQTDAWNSIKGVGWVKVH